MTTAAIRGKIAALLASLSGAGFRPLEIADAILAMPEIVTLLSALEAAERVVEAMRRYETSIEAFERDYYSGAIDLMLADCAAATPQDGAG